MSNSKLVTVILSVVLVVSLASNVYFLTKTNTSNDAVRVSIIDTLSQIQVQTDTELDRVGQSIIYASQQLSTAGLTGARAETILSALVANSSFIIDAGTQNLNGIMVAVQPDEYSSTIGQNVGEQKWLNTNPDGAITPMMTPFIPLIENCSGIAMAAPIFNVNKEMIGVVSVIFNPQQLLDASIKAVTTDPQFEFTVMQLNGLIMSTLILQLREKLLRQYRQHRNLKHWTPNRQRQFRIQHLLNGKRTTKTILLDHYWFLRRRMASDNSPYNIT